MSPVIDEPIEMALDAALALTFPASDPIAVTCGDALPRLASGCNSNSAIPVRFQEAR